MAKPKYLPPVGTGDQIELTVESQGSSGDGIYHHEGFTLFVPEGLPGDRLLVEVTKITPRFGVTRVVNSLELSADRVEAPCPVFPACGGCKFQNLNYEKQLSFKRQVVEDSLKHIGKIEYEGDIQSIPADQPYHYRNKGSFAVQKPDDSLNIGFFRQGTHDVVDSDRCDILLDPINNVKEWIRGLLVRHKVSIYDESRHKGFFRGLLIRHGENTGETLIGFITTAGRFPNRFIEELTAPEAIQRFKLTGIVQNLNMRDTNIILGPKTRTLWGENRVTERLDELVLGLSLDSFFQVNSRQTLRLYQLIEQWTASPDGLIIDAYSGVGGIALWLGRTGREVVGIEEVPSAVANARRNARLNNIETCTFLEGTFEKHLKQFIRRTPVHTLIVDPPRKGCSEDVIRSISKINPEQVIYVSCNPATLARDLSRLESYRIEDIRVLDMFPQTQHVETVVRLFRK